jgi:tripartite-type tricarboxylate transporter receptor subunit TctC
MLKAALRGDPLMEFVLPQPPQSPPGSIAAYIAALCALVVFAMPASAQQSAQQYPNKPIRVIVAFGAGGIADTIARLIGQKLSERYGQQIVVDNRPGAGGTLGARLVAGANPDGYTLLVITAAIAVNASAAKEAVDPRTDLAPVALTASTPTVFAVHRSVTAKNLMDYVRGVKGGRFTYATAGVGTTEHLTSEFLFKAVSGLSATHVPFQGGIAPVTAVAGQQVDMATTTVPTAFPLIKQGSLRIMAVASRKRIAVLPEVPTLAESGFPDFENASWIGYFAPARTPPAVIQALNAEINNALRQADVQERLAALGFDAHDHPQLNRMDFING